MIQARPYTAMGAATRRCVDERDGRALYPRKVIYALWEAATRWRVFVKRVAGLFCVSAVGVFGPVGDGLCRIRPVYLKSTHWEAEKRTSDVMLPQVGVRIERRRDRPMGEGRRVWRPFPHVDTLSAFLSCYKSRSILPLPTFLFCRASYDMEYCIEAPVKREYSHQSRIPTQPLPQLHLQHLARQIILSSCPNASPAAHSAQKPLKHTAT